GTGTAASRSTDRCPRPRRRTPPRAALTAQPRRPLSRPALLAQPRPGPVALPPGPPCCESIGDVTHGHLDPWSRTPTTGGGVVHPPCGGATRLRAEKYL